MGCIEDLCRGKSNDYLDGMIQGMRIFAWWKDGAEHVGTGSMLFSEAQALVETVRHGDIQHLV